MGYDIKLPKRFIKKLEEHEIWHANVVRVIENVQDYFYESPYYFPEYTNHGILHIRKVLDLCNHMIPDTSMNELSARELGILIIAVLIHDLGMFIKKDGLNLLLFGEKSDYKTELLDKYTWKEEWQTYLNRLMRYSDKKMIRIFGETKSVNELPLKLKEVDDVYKLVYGDFLRQNHPRLAYEIVNYGFVGNQTVDILNNTGIDNSIRDIIALIARSHGMSLRDTYEYLSERFVPPAEPKRIRIYYLMSVLRMADALDAGYDRASHVIEAMQSKHSPISQEEYSWNQVIDYEDYLWDNTLGFLNIHANPNCSSQFLKVENWLHTVQKELDLCWAVLGEYYAGKYQLNLQIRRVSSNILEEKTRKHFEEKFVTKKAVLDTNPDILKLLIYPLYNEDPKYGVRELLQNAVDACNERRLIEKNKGNIYVPKITIEVNRNEETFQITDNGIGMSEDVIINYFLVSGASFRNSDIWEGKFKNNQSSLIARTGKFGIGVLATFLLGSQVEIITRSENERLGYVFSIEIGRENINIERTKAEIGTSLLVKSNRELLTELVTNTDYPTWTDWYCFNNPEIQYILDGVVIQTEEEYVPDADEKFEGWYPLPNPYFKSYKWSYSHRIQGEANAFCNGIPIPKGCKLNAEEYGFPLATPSISIIDYDNQSHINLSRDQLTEFPCEHEFVPVGFKYAIINLVSSNLIHEIASCSHAQLIGFPYCKEFGFTRTDSIKPSAYVFSNYGYTLMSPAFLKYAGISKLMLLCVKSYCLEHFKPKECGIPLWLCGIGERGRRRFFAKTFRTIFQDEKIVENVTQFIVDKDFFLTELKDFFDTEQVTNRFFLISEENECFNYSVDGSRSMDLSDLKIDFSTMKKQGILAAIIYDIHYAEDMGLMSHLLEEYLSGSGWIPYEEETRKLIFPKIYEESEEIFASD